MNQYLNFEQHLKEIVVPVMKELGFKKKNLNFTRINGRYIETIVLQKSRWNLPDSEKVFYINFYIYLVGNETRWISFNRLNNKMKNAFLDDWGFFDESDLLKVLFFLSRQLRNYVNQFYSEMETYLDNFPEINKDIENEIESNCTNIFRKIENKIQEEEILTFSLEKELELLPQIELLSHHTQISQKNKLEYFHADILNQGRLLKGLKIVVGGKAINEEFIHFSKIICKSSNGTVLYENNHFIENEINSNKFIIFAFDDLEIEPGYDREKLKELAKADKFAYQRAKKYHSFDRINFFFYYDIKKYEKNFIVYFCPNENFEEGQAAFSVNLIKNNQ